jgi:hypothetical protein
VCGGGLLKEGMQLEYSSSESSRACGPQKFDLHSKDIKKLLKGWIGEGFAATSNRISNRSNLLSYITKAKHRCFQSSFEGEYCHEASFLSLAYCICP